MITSCSKDTVEDGAQKPPVDETYGTLSPFGIFEGEWRLSKYGQTCEGEIVVSDNAIIMFDLPADYLLPRLGLVDETTKARYSDEPFYTTTAGYTYSNTNQSMSYTLQGYSDVITYSTISEIENAYTSKAAKAFSFGVMADGMSYRIDLIAVKDEPTAVFDIKTGLWTIGLPIDKITIINLTTGRQIPIETLDEKVPEKSAWTFIFRAARKIK